MQSTTPLSPSPACPVVAPMPVAPFAGPPGCVAAWTAVVRAHLPHLSTPVASVLALWSLGMVLAHSCGLTSVACTVAHLLDIKEGTARQRLREWCYAKEHKRGAHRQEWDVTTCFGPLLRWVLTWWAPGEHRLALAMDATTLGQRFTVLAISVVYRGCAIPVAWTVVAATEKGAWRPHWEDLLRHLRGSVPPDWDVLVCADRGLYARWLYRHIVTVGWHPFLRINQGGLFRIRGQARWRSLTSAAPQPGHGWSGGVRCFKTQPLDCTLLARWDAPHDEPWLIVTDLAPVSADACWYSLRAWIECGFKDTKRGGWHWEQTKMTDPARAERLWLAIAVATLWVLSAGSAQTDLGSASSLPDDPLTSTTGATPTRRSRPRLLSVFRRGLLTLVVALLKGDGLVFGQFRPEPWPRGTPLQRVSFPEDQGGSFSAAA